MPIKKPNWIIVLVSTLLLAFLLFLARLFFAGNEDAWICVSGHWLKHGNPSAPMPTTPCQ